MIALSTKNTLQKKYDSATIFYPTQERFLIPCQYRCGKTDLAGADAPEAILIFLRRVAMKNDEKSDTKRSTGRQTLADVAKRAGVSPITASRALAKPEMVSEKLRERIERAVKELGYIPNQAARALASSKTRVISIIVPSLTNAVFGDVLNGIDHTLTLAGYRILLGNSHYSTSAEDDLIATMLQQNPDGMIITGIDQSARARELLTAARIPVVQLMELTDSPLDMIAGVSQFDAGYQMTGFLIEKGYKHIGFIGARMDKRSQRRMQGYQQALADANRQTYVMTNLAPTSFQLGGEMMADLARQHPEIDALFFSNDDLAAGAIFECQRLGIKVPEQLAIAGFNNLGFAGAMNPGLTTVSIPRYQMGIAGAQLLLDRLNGESETAPNIIDVGFEIVARGSTRG